ncbi:MAG: tetratricopeptide repeat protein [Candidatus Firestonebacteria bacterium]|nr:tetratricopeptide repeat protein [Candidatus Firestonebacteria bacterium]
MKKEKQEFKKALHTDGLVSFTARTVEYFRNPANTKKWLDILFYAVIAVVALFMLNNCRVNRNNTVKNKLVPAEMKFFAGDYEGVLPLLKDIQKDYPNTKYTGEALYYLGEANCRLGKYEEAVKVLEEAKIKRIPDAMKPLVYSALAYACEELKDYTKAAAVYEEALKKFSSYYRRDELLSNQARCLKLSGKAEEAKSRYEEIINKYPTSPYLENAKQNLGR